jgi:flagellar motor switch protein FliN/FliY
MENKKQSQAMGEVKNLEFLLDIPLQISVEVGRTRILIKELLEMQEGSVIELDKLAGEPLDVYVNSRLIARGEAVLVNEKFGIRLTDVVSPAERIENLG